MAINFTYTDQIPYSEGLRHCSSQSTQCLRCQKPFPHMNPVHRQQVRAHACAPLCLNVHALGEQWIGEVSDVDTVQPPREDSHEGDQLIFKAHIRGWETEVRRTRCQYLKEKSDLALRQTLLKTGWKDILLIPQSWYPAESPKFETAGSPAERSMKSKIPQERNGQEGAT